MFKNALSKKINMHMHYYCHKSKFPCVMTGFILTGCQILFSESFIYFIIILSSNNLFGIYGYCGYKLN